MNAEDLYCMREDLMTPEELEEHHHDPSFDEIPTYTDALQRWILHGCEDDDDDFAIRPAPEAATRRDFERRPSAIGATPQLLVELKGHHVLLSPVQQRMLYRHLRSTMLRQLISCDGAATMDDLVIILREEMDSGTSPVPEWYKYSTVTMGPRKIGYDGCTNRGCNRTEAHDQPRFSSCSKCKVAIYCSRECQAADWKARHKKVCKEAAKEREQITRMGKMMQGISDLSMTGQDATDSFGNLRTNYREVRRDPAVRERRQRLKAEKKRPKDKSADGPDPKFF